MSDATLTIKKVICSTLRKCTVAAAGKRPSKKAFALFVCSLLMMIPMAEVLAQPYGNGLPTETWEAGTRVGYIPNGSRITAFHKGYLFLPQNDGGDGTTIWDISDVSNPVKVDEGPGGGNGHMWVKIGDLFWRQYSARGEIETGSGEFLDMSKLPKQEAWTTPMSFPINSSAVTANGAMQTFPLRYSDGPHEIIDVRTGEVLDVQNLKSMSGVTGTGNIWRIGNLLLMTPGDGQSGMAIFDVGDPTNIRLLDNYTGNVKQYSTSFQIWRNYVVLLTGGSADNGPSGSANMVGIDISNPTDIKIGFELPKNKLDSRYAHFQDEFAFGGGFGNYKKLNMETKEVVQEFSVPSNRMSNDFQAIPLGHILMTTGDGFHTNFFAHQDGLDRKAPTVGFQWPQANATNLPVTSVIGFVINESLMGETVNDANIQVRPVGGGSAVAADVTHMQCGVVNFCPKQPLAANTTYEVKFVAGGVKDVAGNGMAEYKFLFSTGSTIASSNNTPPVVSEVAMTPASPVSVNTAVSFTATATDVDDDALTYRWDFGDASAQTAFGTSNTISHTFASAGNYTVMVQVKDAQGEITSRTKSLVVVEPVTGPLPTRSSSIVVDDAGRRVWVVNSDNDNVVAINADNLSIVHNKLVGKHPTSVAVDGNNQVWVTCREDGKVHILNKNTGNLISTIALHPGAQPVAIVFNPEGTTGYIAEYATGRITRVNASTRATSGSISVGPTPSALAITSDGEKLLVSRFISGSNGGTVYTVNLDNFTAGTAINLPIDNTTDDSEVAGRGIPNYVAGLAISPDNARAWYVGKKDNILRGLARDGATPTFETTLRFLASPINLSSNAEITASRKDIDNHGRASAVAFSPEGNHIFLTEQGNNRLFVLNASNGQEITRVDVGRAPQGVAIDPTTKRVFTENFMGRSVTVFNAAGMLTQGTTTLTDKSTINIVTTEKLSATVLKGKQIFYDASNTKMAKDGYMDCSSCHLDGREDGRNWDFTHRGEGLRNTIALRGRAGGQGRVHWSANFDEIHDFENDIRAHFGGTGFMTDAQFNTGTRSQALGDTKAGVSTDLDALVAYIQSLDTFDPSPYRNTNGTLTSDAAAGKVLFQDLNCGSCHSGNDFTNSATGLMHDVGTISTSSGKRSNAPLLGMDVPTLKDVWQTPPYLHDGSAATLAAVLTTKNPDGKHGATNNLSTTQINQLVAYLQQIDGSETSTATSVSLTLSAPAANASITAGTATPLSITTDITGISEVRYYANGIEIASSTTSPYSATWTNPTAGTYLVQAKVIHSAGTGTISREVKVTVTGGTTALRNPENPTNTTAGLEYLYYEGVWSALPDFDALTVAEAGEVTNFDLSIRNRDDNFGVQFKGFIEVPADGTYTFYTSSDDGSKLYIGTTEVVDNDGLHGIRERSGTIGLKAGKHALTVIYFENTGGQSLLVSYSGPNLSKTAVPASALFRTGGGSTDPDPTPGSLTKITGTTFGTAPWTNCTTCTADKVFDGNTATYFDANAANGAYAGIDAGSAKVVTQIRFYPRAGNLERMTGGKFQGSNTSSSSGFVDLYTIPSQPTEAWQTVDLSTNTTAYRYLRYLSPDGGFGNISEAEFYTTISARLGNEAKAAEAATLSATVYPTPASDQLQVTVEAARAGEAHIGLTSLLNQEVMTSPAQLKAGKNLITLPVGHLRRGLYLLSVYKDGRKVGTKVVLH